jgi:hypothetical protein
MYGLEKEDKGAKRFAFDLEKELKTNPAQGKAILAKVDERLHEIKKHLRVGANEKEFEQFGILLHGYAALQKVLKKATK